MDTEIKLKGDKIIEQIPSIKDKALRINLNENIYGTLAKGACNAYRAVQYKTPSWENFDFFLFKKTT